MHVLDVKDICFKRDEQGWSLVEQQASENLRSVQTHWTLLFSFSALGSWCHVLFGAITE